MRAPNASSIAVLLAARYRQLGVSLMEFQHQRVVVVEVRGANPLVVLVPVPLEAHVVLSPTPGARRTQLFGVYDFRYHPPQIPGVQHLWLRGWVYCSPRKLVRLVRD